MAPYSYMHSPKHLIKYSTTSFFHGFELLPRVYILWLKKLFCIFHLDISFSSFFLSLEGVTLVETLRSWVELCFYAF